MKKAALDNLGALNKHPAPLPLWPGDWQPLGPSVRAAARSLRTFVAMQDKSNSLSAVLLGTNTDRRYTVLLHGVFWLASYWWFVFQSRWLCGQGHPYALTLVTVVRYGTVLATFYLASYCIGHKWSGWLVGALLFLLPVLSLLSYSLLTYYLYNYVNSIFPDMPPYFKNVVKAISERGPWTFLFSIDVLYIQGVHLVIGFFIPAVIKVFRATYQSRIKGIALEKDNLKLELEFLRAQINPHFLFNTLNSVYSLIEDKDKTAALIIVSLSDMMRYALYDAAATEVDVAKELAFIQNYIEIQQIRHRRRLEVALEIAPDLGPQRIPPLLLINFVENAVKHGVDKLRHDAWVRIQAYRDELGTFCFAVANARPAQAGAEIHEGIGTRNTRRRLDILYPGAYSLQTSHTATQFDILLRLWPPHNG